ncbi:MAG: glycine cleavage T C-terminal barrel domain-containing protein, partial [bacterium]
SWVVAFEKGDFIGREALHRQRTQGVRRQLVALELVEKAVPRHGCRILETRQGEKAIGVVTSGNLSPILQKGIGLGYVPPSKATPGISLTVDIRGRRVPALVVKPPFYTKQASG